MKATGIPLSGTLPNCDRMFPPERTRGHTEAPDLQMPVTNLCRRFTFAGMKQRAKGISSGKARRWALRLSARMAEVLAAYPDADPDNVRHTLILLELPPLERLRRSLIRGRATAVFRK